MKKAFNAPVAAVCDRRHNVISRVLRRSQTAAATLFFVFLAFLCGNSISPAQVQQAWVAKYNNSIPTGSHRAEQIVLDGAGSIYVTGFSQNTNGNLDYATIKYASNGTQIWGSRFESTNTTTAQATGLVLDWNTNVIVTGSACTVKYDNHGNQLWTAPYSGYNVAVDGSNNLFVPGSWASFGVVKLNPGGTNLWQMTHSSASYGPAIGQLVSVDSSGNSYVAGYVVFYAEGEGPYYLGTVTKYDPNGREMWYEQYQSGYWYFPDVQSTALDRASNFYLLFNGTGPGGNAYSTTEYAGDNGSVVWNAYDPTGNGGSMAHAFTLASGGNVWVTGAKYSAYYAYTNTQYGTYKINTNGVYIATNIYPSYPSGFPSGTILSAGKAIAVDQANSVYVTGYSPGTNTGNDIVTIKYDSNGNQIWLQRYNGPGNGDDEGNAIAVDANGNVYVSGYETTTAGGTEFVTIKYAPTASIQKQTNGAFLLQEQGEPGEAFDFQASTNLQTWFDLGATNADTNGCVQFLDTNAPLFDYRFYLTLPQ